MPCPKEAHENGADTQAGQDDQDNDSDSDYDDDVFRVTIGDIKTEDSSQSTSGHTPVNLNIKAEGKVHAVVGTKSKGVDASGSIKGIPVLDVDVESFEEKPWEKPGADISDYFNYGFNEETWKAYCEKQWRLRANFESMTLSSTKIMVRKDTGHISFWSYYLVNRKTSGTIDVIGGHCGSISRVEGRRRHSNEGNNIQVLSETSSDGAKIISFPPFNIPPPPLLPPPSNINSAPPLIPPPPFPHPPGVRPPPLIPNLDSSSRRRHGGEEDSHHRQKHKRAKRSGEDKETSNELSTDEENQS
ncbi:pre-mRNA 3'-end-processing factor FIP1 [Centroberyx affinis]|uniref:pre-mRNA 3'-end-processing factor FIP1 n=1 Tax=Centroberyx affinis TaxID=166261 RepID=UPI003A5C6C33